MGSEIGEFAEQTLLYEAACNADPVLRLTGVNRALEGLAIDVFNTMRDFGDATADPVLYFCEDWMLADEVTHVKMGSDWLRRLTAKDPERQQAGARLPAHGRQAVQLRRLPRRGGGEPGPPRPQVPRASPASPTTRSAELVDVAAEAYAEAQAHGRRGRRRRQQRLTCPVRARSCSTSTTAGRGSSSSATGSPGVWALARQLAAERCAPARCGGSPSSSRWRSSSRSASASALVAGQKLDAAAVPHVLRLRRIIAVGIIYSLPRSSCAAGCYLLYGFGGLFLMGLGIRALLVGRDRLS